jgi:Proline dehydrogenase
MLATHDPRLIEITTSLALLTGRAPDSFEYQMLYGIRPPSSGGWPADTARACASTSPTAATGTPYLVRRLAERPQNLGFFLRSLGRNS